MNPTSVSLLDRIKAARPDASDWKSMQDIYLPLIQHWLGRIPDLGEEAADLAQEVFVVVIRETPRFQRQREGSFRAWLRQVTVNKVRSHRKQRYRRPALGHDLTDGFLDQMADHNSELARECDREHDEHVVHKLLSVIQPDFTRRPGRRSAASLWTAYRRPGWPRKWV